MNCLYLHHFCSSSQNKAIQCIWWVFWSKKKHKGKVEKIMLSFICKCYVKEYIVTEIFF